MMKANPKFEDTDFMIAQWLKVLSDDKIVTVLEGKTTIKKSSKASRFELHFVVLNGRGKRTR